MVQRTKTGICGFDCLVQGGFPKNSTILLSGSPATGKTIFGLQFLYNGAKKYKEPGLYISCEETKENLIKTSSQFRWDLKKLMDEKKIILKTFPKEELFLDTLFADINRQVNGYKIKRIVIDSLTTLNFRRTCEIDQDEDKHLSDKEKLKKFIFNLISRLNDIKATKVLISEVEGDDERQLASEGASPFLCDGIIFVKYRTMGGTHSRELVVRKMRHTKNRTEFRPLEITPNGIVIKDFGGEM